MGVIQSYVGMTNDATEWAAEATDHFDVADGRDQNLTFGSTEMVAKILLSLAKIQAWPRGWFGHATDPLGRKKSLCLSTNDVCREHPAGFVTIVCALWLTCRQSERRGNRWPGEDTLDLAPGQLIAKVSLCLTRGRK